jgi:hypothetical protein
MLVLACYLLLARREERGPTEGGLSLDGACRDGLLVFARGGRLFAHYGAATATHLADAGHGVAFPEGVGGRVAKLTNVATDLATTCAGRPLRRLDNPVVLTLGYFLFDRIAVLLFDYL